MQYECISNVVFEIAIDDGGGIKKLYISAIKMPLEDNMPMEVMWFVRIKGCWLAGSLQRNASFCVYFTWVVGLDPFRSVGGGSRVHMNICVL